MKDKLQATLAELTAMLKKQANAQAALDKLSASIELKKQELSKDLSKRPEQTA